MSVASLLANTGGTSAKFDQIGDTHEGTIVSTEAVQRRDFTTNEPATWDDGSAQMQIVVTLETQERDASDPDDDGTRKLYLKAWGQSMKELKRAVQAAGDTDLQPGGHFTVTYARDGEQKKRGFNAPKEFAMEYRKPSGTAGLINAPVQEATPAPTAQAASAAQPAPQQPVEQSQPAQAAPAQGNDQVSIAKQLIATGLDDNTIHGTTGLDLPVIAALRNAS